jgi:hypothetical protein
VATGLGLLVLFVFIGMVSRVMPRAQQRLPGQVVPDLTAAKPQVDRGAVNERYWKDAVLRAFEQFPEHIEAGDTVASLLEHDLSRQKVNLDYARRRPTVGVDTDLIGAVARWIEAQDKLVQWCADNKLIMLDAAKDLSVDELSQFNDLDFVKIIELLPPDKISPEIAELHQSALSIDAALAELDQIQIELSRRYPDRQFPVIGN